MVFAFADQNVKSPSADQEKPFRTLVIDLSKGFGGANTRTLGLIRRLSREQKISLAALTDSPVAIEAERAGFQVFPVGRNKTSLMIVPRLISIIRREGIQIVDTQNPQSKLWGSIAASFTRVAFVSTLNSWYGTEHSAGSWRSRFYSMLELRTNAFLDRYVVVSRSIYDALVKNGIAPDKIDLIYNAVETDGFPLVPDQESPMEAGSLPVDAIVLVAAGRLTWAKGYEDLIKALAILVKEDDRIYCLVAGDGELRESLKTLIEQLGLDQHIILLGHLSRQRVLSLIASCDIFVMPSRSEGTPIALLEAASFKKPIVATLVGGIPELMKNEDECLLVESGNVFELANSMRRLIQDKVLSEQLGERAYRRVLSDFSLDAQARSTIQTYIKALQSRNKRMQVHST